MKTVKLLTPQRQLHHVSKVSHLFTKKNRIKTIAILLSLVVLLSLMITHVIYQTNNDLDMTCASISEQQSIKGIVSVKSRELKNGIVVDVARPHTSFSNYNSHISKVYDTLLDTFTTKPIDGVTKLSIDFSCYIYNQKILSTKVSAVMTDKEQNIVSEAFRTIVFDIIDSDFLNITDIFNAQANTYVAVSDSICDAIIDSDLRGADNSSVDEDLLHTKINADPNSFSNFILTSDSLYFLFSPKTLSQAVTAGSPIVVCCPLSEVEDIVNDVLLSKPENSVDSFALPEPTTLNVPSLSEPKHAAKTSVNSKRVALTFDDGPSIYTPKLLRVLKKYGVKVTFFTLGSYVKLHKSTVRKAFKNGHEIGIHSFGHEQLTKLSSSAVKRNLSRCKKLLCRLLGPNYEARALRPPYGSYDNRVLKIAKRLGLSNYLWSMDTLDWKYLDKKRNIRYVTKHVKNNDIILMHDSHKASVQSIKQIIINLSKKGYEFVTVDELIGKPKKGESYFSGK